MQAKFQWLKNPNQMNGDNLNNARYKTDTTLRNQKRESLKDKINVLETNSKNKNIRKLYRGINEYKNGTNTEQT
jgi:hypothetical protein